MSFQEFDMHEIEEAKKKYAKEAKERWGDTEAYRESEKKTSGYGEEKWRALNGEMSDIFREFAECANAGETPEGSRAAGLVEGLGKMYVGDGRFKENIDQFGEHTAEFMSRAIESYCKR